MKLARNAVYALTHTSIRNTYAFLHVNKDDLINPFWIYKCGVNGFSLHGELCREFCEAGGHEHWRDIGSGTKVTMIQSHVTKASDIDFKRCMKFAQKVKRK
ncbi:hypothetical protein JYR10_001106 [Salmonella enterica subsp. enterica serovar Kentucky]|nr:hypothetical protein [Salmonella enterica subsp. enterica serovar Kentucky]